MAADGPEPGGLTVRSPTRLALFLSAGVRIHAEHDNGTIVVRRDLA